MTDFLGNIEWGKSIQLWHLIVLFGLLMLGVFWEYRKQKPRVLSRTIALPMAFISLYIIYLDPYTLIEKTKESIVFVNDNTDKNTIDSLSQQYDLKILRATRNGGYALGSNKKVRSISDLAFQIDTAYVYGYFPQLDHDNYVLRKDLEIKKGFEVDFPKSVALGDSLTIGINHLESKTIEVLAVIDQDTLTKKITPKAHSQIKYFPKSAGYVLNEITMDGASYNFAILVKEPEHHVIQILAAAPDFEWKFLGDHLKSKSHSVFQKTKISTGKYKSSFFNWHDSLQANRGVANHLKILFADAQAWQDLGANDRARYLKTLMANRGSLIFRSNPNTKIQLGLDKPKPTNIFSTSDNLIKSKGYNYLQFNNIKHLDEVAKNSVFRKVTPDLIYGVINFQNSYELKLSGKKQKYEEIWSPVFTDLVRKTKDIFYDKSAWALQHQPFFFRLWSDDLINDIIIFNTQNDTIKLKARTDDLYPEREHFMFYPKKTGWHFIQIKNQADIIPFFVHQETQANQSEFLRIYNHDYLNYLNFDNSNTQEKKKSYNEESVTLWFFLLFLMSVGYLWIEDKIT